MSFISSFSDIATSESSLEITFDDLKSIEFSDLYSGLSLKGLVSTRPKQNLTHQHSHYFELKPGSNCSISGITFEGGTRRSTPKCGTNQEVSDTSVILWFENHQVDLSQVRNSRDIQYKVKCIFY